MFVEVLMHVLLKNVISSQSFVIHGCFTFTGSLGNHFAKSIRFSRSWKIDFYFSRCLAKNLFRWWQMQKLFC